MKNWMLMFIIVSMWISILVASEIENKIDVSIDQCKVAFEVCDKAKIEPVPCHSSLLVDNEGNLFFRGYGDFVYGYTEEVRFCPCPEPQIEKDKP